MRAMPFANNHDGIRPLFDVAPCPCPPDSEPDDPPPAGASMNFLKEVEMPLALVHVLFYIKD